MYVCVLNGGNSRKLDGVQQESNVCMGGVVRMVCTHWVL